MPSPLTRSRDLPPVWRYGLVGGLASLPFTVGAYWWSGGGGRMSLSFVAAAGLVAGFLAAGRVDDVGRAGLRAGVVGALPVLWLAYRLLETTFAPMEPAWFRAAGVFGAVVLAGLGLFLSGVVGSLCGKVGGWLAVEAGLRPVVERAGRTARGLIR